MKTVRLNYLSVATLLLLGASVSSCTDRQGNMEQNSRSSMQKTDDSSAAIISRSDNTTAREKTDLRARMKELQYKIDVRLDTLNREAKTADANTRRNIETEKSRLTVAKDSLKKEFDRFSAAADRDWDKVKANISTGVDSLERKLKLD